MNRPARENILGQFTKIDMPTCKYRLVDKTTKIKINKLFKKGTRVETLLQLIHFDTDGPMSIRAMYGALYFITFIDDFNYYDHVYLISHKVRNIRLFQMLH